MSLNTFPPDATGLMIGLGLMGGSLLRDATHLPIQQWWGSDCDPDCMRLAQQDGAIRGAWSRSLSPAAVLVLAVPASRLGSALVEHREAVGPRTLVMDLCSLKTLPANQFDALLPEHPGVVPCHPMAGTEGGGWSASRSGLFAGRPVFLCPRPQTAPWALEAARSFWTALQAQPILCDPETHDRAVALLSHLPHLVSRAYLDLVQSTGTPEAWGGPGFRDFSRLGRSPRPLWDEVFQQNHRPLKPALDQLIEALQAWSKALEGAQI